ncbi:MAG: hypothetical protein ACRYF4_09090 [Janthinobacterium lividum]
MQQRVETGGQKSPGARATRAQPPVLSAAAFASYPPQARALTVRNLSLLQRLPLPLLPLLLREMSAYDWRFPRERDRIDAQLAYLRALQPDQRAAVVAPFAALHLPAALADIDWINDPGSYLDALTATLWSSGEMPAFRQAAKDYAAAMPAQAARTGSPRLVVATLDASLTGSAHFARLREHGVTLRVSDPDGMDVLLAHLQQRAATRPEPYTHWYVDGGVAALADNRLTQVSYDALAPVRASLLGRARNVISAERSGPEELRSLMARTTPEQIGMLQADPTLAHFQLSLLTEGSGTQIFSTTFVQWAARECLRRAEPETLLLRFTPRQAQQGMDQMLAGAAATGADPAGSRIDAEQAAYYTWMNLTRLPGAAEARFLAWHAGSGLAVAIGPGLARGTSSLSPYNMPQALRLLA